MKFLERLYEIARVFSRNQSGDRIHRIQLSIRKTIEAIHGTIVRNEHFVLGAITSSRGAPFFVPR